MEGRARVVAAGLMMAVQVSSSAQPTYRSGIELVTLNVTVLDARSNEPVLGLTEDQFQVYEDGRLQEVSFFDAGDLPLDIFVVLDTSASMMEAMPLVQEAASRLVRALRAGDRAAVMGISGGLRVLQELTSDRESALRAIRGTRPRGDTPLYASLYTALRELEKVRSRYAEPRRQAIVMLSDGIDTASTLGFSELLDALRRHAVPVYVIAPRAGERVRLQREALFGESTREQDYELRTLADETGGRAFFPEALHELAGIYDHIANELAHQYSLGYRSSNVTFDGRYRQIALRVTAPGVRWRTRAGYIADPSAGAASLDRGR